jgi:hypothetical protein
MIGDDAPRGLTHFELLSACWTGFQPYLGGDQNTLADGLNAGVVTSDGLMVDIVYRSCVCGVAPGVIVSWRTTQLPSLAGAV